MSARVSIGLPVFNGGCLLDDALTSLRTQTERDLEIIVSDNASTDDTPSTIARHAAVDARIVVHRFDEQVDVFANFAEVFERATGTYFMWAAHDDRWPPDYVERLVAKLEDDHRAVLACGIPSFTDADGSVRERKDAVGDLPQDGTAARLEAFIRQHERLGKACIIYGVHRRAALTDVDVRSFLSRDARRNDYHLNLAVLARGGLVVDAAVSHLKREVPAEPDPAPRRRLQAQIRSTRTAWGWISAYAGVLDELDLRDDERRQLQRAITARRVEILTERLCHLARGVADYLRR